MRRQKKLICLLGGVALAGVILAVIYKFPAPNETQVTDAPETHTSHVRRVAPADGSYSIEAHEPAPFPTTTSREVEMQIELTDEESRKALEAFSDGMNAVLAQTAGEANASRVLTEIFAELGQPQPDRAKLGGQLCALLRQHPRLKFKALELLGTLSSPQSLMEVALQLGNFMDDEFARAYMDTLEKLEPSQKAVAMNGLLGGESRLVAGYAMGKFLDVNESEAVRAAAAFLLEEFTSTLSPEETAQVRTEASRLIGLPCNAELKAASVALLGPDPAYRNALLSLLGGAEAPEVKSAAIRALVLGGIDFPTLRLYLEPIASDPTQPEFLRRLAQECLQNPDKLGERQR